MSEAKQLEIKRNIQVDQQILTFQLKGELFGLEILKVKELLEYNGITKVPMVPDYIRGVINLRGSVVPVVDLMYLFSKTPSEITKKSCVIIVESSSGESTSFTGILVDNVNEVIDILGKDIESAPAFGTNLRTNFILGMAKVGEKIIILLDMKYLLSFDELSNMSQYDFKSLYEQQVSEKA
jgi:purine-binding chemotaxis protein CheW